MFTAQYELDIYTQFGLTKHPQYLEPFTQRQLHNCTSQSPACSKSGMAKVRTADWQTASDREGEREKFHFNHRSTSSNTGKRTQPRGRLKWIQFLEDCPGRSELMLRSDSTKKLIKEMTKKRYIDDHPAPPRLFTSR